MGYIVGVTVNELLVAEPYPVVTDMAPVVAPVMTIAFRMVPALDTMMAGTPPMDTEVGLDRLLPLIVTNVPTAPEVGENPLIVGACPNPSMLISMTRAIIICFSVFIFIMFLKLRFCIVISF
jgi:hypothetical protein